MLNFPPTLVIFLSCLILLSLLSITNFLVDESFASTGKIVFTDIREAENDEIYVMDEDGSNQIRLTDMAGIDTYPSWSPDGKKIAFTSTRDDGSSEIYAMDEDGSNPINLTNSPDSNDSYPSFWSPSLSESLITHDITTKFSTQIIPLEGNVVYGIAINHDTNMVYVANSQAKKISVIDGDTNKVVDTILDIGEYPYELAVNQITNMVYVTNLNDDTISIIDGNTNKVVDTISVGDGPYDVKVNQKTNTVFVVNQLEDTMFIINDNTSKVVDKISVGDFPKKIAINKDTNIIYVTNTNDDTISIIDGNTNKVVDTISVGDGPFGIAVNQKTNTVFVVNTNENTVSVIDGDVKKVVDKISVGDTPWIVAVNENTNTAYVGSSEEGTVHVIKAHTKNTIDDDMMTDSADSTTKPDSTDQPPVNGECVNTKITTTDAIGSFTVTTSNSEETIHLTIKGSIDKHEVKNSEEPRFFIDDPNCNQIHDERIDGIVSADSFGEFNGNMQLKEMVEPGTYTMHGTYNGKNIGSNEFKITILPEQATSVNSGTDSSNSESEEFEESKDSTSKSEEENISDSKEDKSTIEEKPKITLSLDPYIDTITAGDKTQTIATVKMISGDAEEKVSLSCEIESFDTNHKIICEPKPEQLTLYHPGDNSKKSTITIKTESTTQPQTYTVTIMAKNDLINTESQKFELEIEDNTIKPEITDININGKKETGSEITFTINLEDPSNLADRFEWMFGDSNQGITTRDKTISHVFENKGQYMVTVNVLSDDSNYIYKVSKSISINIEEPALIDTTILAIIGTAGGLIIGLAKLFMSRQKSQNKNDDVTFS